MNQQLKLGENTLCFTAFREVLGVPERTLRRWKAGVREGFNPEASLSRSSVKASVTASWLSSYARSIGDAQPDKPVYHLPATLWKKDVYEEFVSSHSELIHLIPSQVCKLILFLPCSYGLTCEQSYFYRIWRRQAPHVLIPSQNRFSKCGSCVLLKTKLNDSSVTTQDRNRLQILRHEHNREHQQERALRDVRKSKAARDPAKYLYISIDGMDSRKCALPILHPYPKDATEFDTFCEPHVTGVITTKSPGHLVFLSSERFSSDSNLSITCLMKTLETMSGPFPNKLYIYVSCFSILSVCIVIDFRTDGQLLARKQEPHCFWLPSLACVVPSLRRGQGWLPHGRTHSPRQRPVLLRAW